MARLLARLLTQLFTLQAATGANVTISFALATIPMVGFVGAAVDYSHANSIKAAMQDAADATALAMSISANSLTTAQLQTNSTKYFKGVFTRPETQGIKVTATYAGTTTLTVAASGTVPTNFLKIMGVNKLKVAATGTAAWGNGKLRVALALDNTGSMGDAGKIRALKTATHQLLATLQSAAKSPGDVQVAIIPFNTDVNVGSAYASAPWLDWTFLTQVGGSWANSSWSTSGSTPWTGRTGWGGSSWDNSGNYQGSGSWGSGGKWSSLQGDRNGAALASLGRDNDDYIYSGATSSSSVQSTWSGCVMDRDQDYDTKNTGATNSQPGTFFPADNPTNGCPVALLPMTSNWSTLSSKVETMYANGTTNQTIGLAWAWLAITPGGPLGAPPLPAGTEQVIVLLTDGLNTQNRFTDVAADIDARTKKACTNIKAAGITLFTVQVNTGGDPTSTMLKNCATDASKFFLLKSSDQIVTAFNSIATTIGHLRLSK